MRLLGNLKEWVGIELVMVDLVEVEGRRREREREREVIIIYYIVHL